MYPVNLYLIHGVDKSRGPRMIEEFKKARIDPSNIKWVVHPNKNELPEELIKQITVQTPSYSNKTMYVAPGSLPRGVISCTFKHYLCLKDIVENKHEYAVIMEDNMKFADGIDMTQRIQEYIGQLNTIYPDWDVCFDLNFMKSAHKKVPGIYVYPKTNEITELNHGGTRCAQFYLIRYKCAKALYENYLPFNAPPDHWMNDLFRKLNIQSFWTDPPGVEPWDHESSAFG